MTVDWLLPEAGKGFYAFGDRQHQYAMRETIEALEAAAAAWNKTSLGPIQPIGIGEISKYGGGLLRPHKAHQRGLDADIRPMRHDRERSPVSYKSDAYSRVATQALVDCTRGNGVLLVHNIFFNDPLIRGVSPFPGHDNHLHVAFSAPGSGVPTLRRGDSGERVEEIQRHLNMWLGAVQKGPLIVDGDFGEMTEAAVRLFQNGAGLVVDGIIGPITWHALSKF